MSGLGGIARLIGSAVVTALLIAACAPRPEPDGEAGDRENSDDSPSRQEAQEAPATEAEIGRGVTLRLALADAPIAGAPVTFTLTATNRSAGEVVLDFPDGQRFDFEVSQAGTSIWRWAADMFFPQMLGRERLPAGSDVDWSATVESGFPVGSYSVRATMTTVTPATIELDFEVAEGGTAR